MQSGSVHRNGVRQVSVLINFKPVVGREEVRASEHRCPKEKMYNGKLLDPWAIGFHPIVGTGTPDQTTTTDGVYAVFKRFYYDSCQMQILFLHQQARILVG